MSDDRQKEGSDPSNRMGERTAGGRLRTWLLMEADREGIATLLVVLVFASLVALGALDSVPLSHAMQVSDPTETLFQALTGAIITGVTLVVTLSQLVISQELGPVGDQRERMRGALDFREESEEVLDVSVAPPEPATYLRALLSAAEDHAQTLLDRVGEGDEGALSGDATDEVRGYADGVRGNARQVQGDLEEAQFGTFAVLSAALDYNYSWKIFEGRTIRHEHGDALPGEAAGALDALLHTLRLFGPAREHFKTLYFEWELVNLSRAMIYTAVPALIVSVGALLYLGSPQSLMGTTLGIDDATWLVSAATTISVAPFALLLSYMLRIMTMAKHTLAIGPFVLRETDRTPRLESSPD